MTPQEIIAGIREGQQLLDQCVELMVAAAQEEAEARVRHKVGWARAYVAAIGAVKQREAEADIACEGEDRNWAQKEAIYKASRDGWTTARDQLSALQSISSTVREEMRLAR